MKIAAAALAIFLLAAPIAKAATLTIENDRLRVSYDEAAGAFTLAEKSSGKAFASQGRLDGPAGAAKVEATDDPVFGAGKRIAVTRGDQTCCSLELYRGLPFVLVREELHNGGDKALDVAKAVPATWLIDLGKPAGELRCLGTAGLTAADKNPGSYLFLTAADPATRRGVVAGWLTNDRGSGVVFSDVKEMQIEFRAQIDYGHLQIPAGQSARLETLAIGLFDDARIGEELYADALAKQYHIKLHPQINGYCTWYSNEHGGAGDEKSIVELGTFAARELKPFGFSFVQIDDTWQDGKSYNGPRRGFFKVLPKGPYPNGMQPVAAALHDVGLTAGIWFMPFARNYQDPEYKDRQDWFVKRADGKPYDTNWGGTSLDLTNPAVRAHVSELVKTIHGWGYNYFKMDGLWTGSATEQIYVNDGYKDDHIGNNAPFHDPSKTNIEVYRDGLKLVREAAGPDVFFSGCNVSQNMRTLGGTIGLVDSMRVGPDNGAGWDGLVRGPVRGSRLYFLNGRTWWNDPDPCYVRAEMPLEHARLITSWVALSGEFNLNSDWLPGLPAERLDILKRTMPAHGATARPVDYFDADLPSIWLVTDRRQKVRRDVIGLFNWDGKDRPLGCSAAKMGLDPEKAYHAFDFWDDKPLPDFRGDCHFDVPARSCRVIAVRAVEGHPLLLSTSRHVTQGMIDVRDEQWDAATSTLSGTSQIVGGDPYELRIAGLEDGGHWKPDTATASAGDKGVEINVSQTATPELLRVTIRTPQSGAVKWEVHFTAK